MIEGASFVLSHFLQDQLHAHVVGAACSGSSETHHRSFECIASESLLKLTVRHRCSVYQLPDATYSTPLFGSMFVQLKWLVQRPFDQTPLSAVSSRCFGGRGPLPRGDNRAALRSARRLTNIQI
jgi:hypothetical protein